MPSIPNSWIKKEKLPKVKKTELTDDKPKHVPTLCRANMQRSLRGTRK